MIDRNIKPGNGLILYIRARNVIDTSQRVKDLGIQIDKDIYLNTNTGQKEFSLRDPDGYYLIISEFHNYRR